MTSQDSTPGQRLRPAGMKAVAERAGVAISSVSRVLSGHPDVSATMRNRVLDAVSALGYEPDMLAQSLRTGETRTIGFVLADISNPLFAAMAHGAETEMRVQGYTLLLSNSLNNEELALQQIRRMHQRRVDGLLVSVGEEADGAIAELLSRSTIPTALIDRKLAVPNASRVLSDHRIGIQAAAESLISLGHRRIALINGATRILPAKARAKALKRVAREHPEVEVQLLPGAFSEAHGKEAVDELWGAGEPPTAIIAGSNQILVGVLAALRERGIRVPDDVSLVTCDSLPLAEFLTPSLAVVWRDAQLMGATAARLLLAQIEDGAARTETLATEYRAADSVAAPRAEPRAGA